MIYGPNYAGVCTGDTESGTAWSDPENAAGPADDIVATAALVSTNSAALLGYDFGFAINPAATITGIQVEVRKGSDLSIGNIVDHLGANSGAQMLTQHDDPDSKVGDDKGDDTTPWPNGLDWVAYGGAGDLWGWSPTPAVLNSPEFSFEISAESGLDTKVASVDAMRVTVYTTDPQFPTSYTDNGLDTNARSLFLDGGTGSPGSNGVVPGDLYFMLAFQPDADINSITVGAVDGEVMTQMAYSNFATNGVITYGLWGIKFASAHPGSELIVFDNGGAYPPSDTDPGLGYTGKMARPTNGTVELADVGFAIDAIDAPDGLAATSLDTGETFLSVWYAFGGGDSTEAAFSAPVNGTYGHSPADGAWDSAWGYNGSPPGPLQTPTTSQVSGYLSPNSTGGRVASALVALPLGATVPGQDVIRVVQQAVKAALR